ncbi:alginate O-acetyltransferase AlgX-related protein [Spirosoma litoris]
MENDPYYTPKPRNLTRYRFFLTGFGFAILLILPGLDQWFGFSSNFQSTEKHILAPFPTFKFPHVNTYINQFNQYYKENFGWRNVLFYQYSHLKYDVLGVSPLPYKVILGKNNWFYPGNDLNNVADQHQGLQPIELQTLQTIVQKLTAKQRKLAAQGIKFYLFIPPDSYTIYPENLPNYLQNNRVISNYDRLKQYLLKNTTIPFIDVRPALLAAKSRHQTYMQTDTHWNDYGAFIATLSVANRIRQDFPDMPLPKENDYSICAKKGYSGDLVTMMALNRDISDTVNYQIDAPPYLQVKEAGRIHNTELGGWPSQRFVSMNKKSPSLLFIGDSFTISLAQFVPNYFFKSYLVRSNLISDELVFSEKPDVVIFEIVERNLAYLALL